MTTKEYREGYEAAERGQRLDSCPYTFKSSGCLAANNQEYFDRHYRPKMDEWFKGWKAYLDERNLGFNFKPKKGSTRKRGISEQEPSK